MDKNLRFFKEAKKEALKSNFSWQFGAVIVDKNKIVSKGRNYEDHTKVPRLFKKNYNLGLHAEIHALMQSNKKVNGLTIFVYGQNKKSQNVLYSKPCNLCQHFLIEKGIKKVFFATKAGYEFIKLKGKYKCK